MNLIPEHDLYLILLRLPRDVRNLIEKNPQLMVAGGFIRACIGGEEIKDIDVFGPDKDYLERCANDLFEHRGGKDAGKLYKSDNAITVLTAGRIPVQFIHRWTFDNLKDCVESFDFSIVQAGLRYHEIEKNDAKVPVWNGGCSDRFYADLAAKRLYYTAPQRNEDAGGSMMRVIKYVKRGYNIQPLSLGKVISRLCNGIRENEALTEEMRGQVIAGLLREVDPLLVIDGLEMKEDHPQ